MSLISVAIYVLCNFVLSVRRSSTFREYLRIARGFLNNLTPSSQVFLASVFYVHKFACQSSYMYAIRTVSHILVVSTNFSLSWFLQVVIFASVSSTPNGYRAHEKYANLQQRNWSIFLVNLESQRYIKICITRLVWR